MSSPSLKRRSSASPPPPKRARSSANPRGVYLPPHKLRALKPQLEALDKNSEEWQRMQWEALRKGLNGLINRVNAANLKEVVPALLRLNLVRGRGLFARALLKAQLASPGFSAIYAALLAVVNTKLPECGELVTKRVVAGYRRAYRRRDKVQATALARFIAHLVNQKVAHELLALQLLMVLLEEPTDDSVEIAVSFVKEVGQHLREFSPKGLRAIFERFRGILHDGDIDKRVQYTIEGLFNVLKADFVDHPAITKELDLVEAEDQITFQIGLDDEIDQEELLDTFRHDPDYVENDKVWRKISREILGEEDDSSDGSSGDSSGDESGSDSSDDEEDEAAGAGGPGDALATPRGGSDQVVITDLTETDLINLRRTIYLTIMSSAGFEESVHKLMKINLPRGHEIELCNMLLECCSQERTYLRYYGLIGARVCLLDRRWERAFGTAFASQYRTIHRLETNKLRNVAKFFAHLLYSDSLPWTVLDQLRLTEADTTSSSRIFIKILLQELSDFFGLRPLAKRFSDPHMAPVFAGLFPTENPRDTRFAINFFTSIGLGGLTDGLRAHLKETQARIKKQMEDAVRLEQLKRAQQESDSSSSSSDSDSDSSSSSDSDSDSDSDSSSSSSSASDSVSNRDAAAARRPPRRSSPPRARRASPPRRRASPPRRRASPPRRRDEPPRPARGDRGRGQESGARRVSNLPAWMTNKDK